MRIAIILAFLSASAFAADAGFEKHKADALAHIEKRITALTEHKTCVTAAADKEAMKKCHEGMKDLGCNMKSGHMDGKMKHMSGCMGEMDEKGAASETK